MFEYEYYYCYLPARGVAGPDGEDAVDAEDEAAHAHDRVGDALQRLTDSDSNYNSNSNV